MKKILLVFLALTLSVFATVIKKPASQELLDSNIPIVDIRTPAEWKETGLIKGSIPIMLFDERGNYDLRDFLNKLNKAVDTSKPFAIICRTGSRTSILAEFLSRKLNYEVIDLQHGIMYAMFQKLPLEPYRP